MSPINGLSEQRRLPRLGKIHLGVKKKSASGKEYPSATEYFVVPPEVARLFGEQPTELPILIPLEDDEIWCNQYYKRYSSARGLVCKGDGKTCRRMIDAQTGDVAGRDTKEVSWKDNLECKGQGCPDYQAKACKEVMNLQFLLPDVPGLGIWQVDTSSVNSIRNVNSAALLIRGVYKRISFIPLLLTLEPMEVVNPDDGKKKMVRVLNLRVRETMRELAAQANKPIVELLLPAPAEDEEPLDTPEEVRPPPTPEKLAQAKKDADELWPEDNPYNKKPPQPPSPQKMGGESPDPTQDTGKADNPPKIDMPWLIESLNTLKVKAPKTWGPVLVQNKLKAMGATVKQKMSETVCTLSEDAQVKFAEEVQEALKLVGA